MFVLANISQQKPTVPKTYTESICLLALQQFLNILLFWLKCVFDIINVGSVAGLFYYDLCSGAQRISANSSVRKHKAV